MIRDRSHGEVISTLEHFLELARQHPYGSIGVVMTGYPQDGVMHFGGDIPLELSTKEALEKLIGAVDQSVDNWSLPPTDDSLDASYVVYNVCHDPPCFDFIPWLVSQEMRRIRLGAPPPLKVAFWLGKNGQPRHQNRLQWLDNVFRPALRLIGAVEDPAAVHGHHEAFFLHRDMTALARKGERVPVLRSKWPYPVEQGAITITLREAEHMRHRNSNLPAWLHFAYYLRGEGYRVIFVRDYLKAFEPIGDFPTAPIASHYLEARAKLYENSLINLFLANGPYELQLFGERPWLCFIRPENENDPEFMINAKSHWPKYQGIEWGEQYPWSRPDQRLTWTDDSLDNLYAAWHDIKESIHGSKSTFSRHAHARRVR